MTSQLLDARPAEAFSLPRLYALRAGYALLAIGLAVEKWPIVLAHDASWELMESVVDCMLAAMSVLAFVGLRYPVRMLPLLLFETAWKVIWLSAVALPAWTSDRLDGDVWATTVACLLVVPIIAVIPWGYVVKHYLLERGDRWTTHPS